MGQTAEELGIVFDGDGGQNGQLINKLSQMKSFNLPEVSEEPTSSIPEEPTVSEEAVDETVGMLDTFSMTRAMEIVLDLAQQNALEDEDCGGDEALQDEAQTQQLAFARFQSMLDFMKAMDEQDLADGLAGLEEIEQLGTVPWEDVKRELLDDPLTLDISIPVGATVTLRSESGMELNALANEDGSITISKHLGNSFTFNP